ncbi:MAG: ABC transporter permease [Candidatus Marinimicrobia bacterium]|nr:ABC transporter permease [Candidatus Neomarinimicrobiota bacterium]
MLGIIIGVASVVVIVSVGAGAQSLILAQIKTLGANLIAVIPGHADEDDPFSAMMGYTVTTLTYDDAVALREKRNVPNIMDVVAYSKGTGSVVWGANSYDTQLNGVTTGYLLVEGGEVEEGRFFTDEEETNLSRVAVLGITAKEEIFGESDAVGQHIRTKNRSFEVIGVLKERGMVAMQDYDDQILFPIKTAQKMFGVNHVGLIRAKIDHEDNVERAMKDVEDTLRERHDIMDTSGKNDDFTVRSAAEALDMITSITDALRYFLAAMAALSLAVGGIGIMNIMLIAVTERTREIGLRKAIGANNSNIMWQFLMESVVVTLSGGVIGIIVGAIMSFAIAVGAQFLGYDWSFIVSIYSILLAIAVSVSIGLIFGIYPARKASKLNPIEALRHE